MMQSHTHTHTYTHRGSFLKCFKLVSGCKSVAGLSHLKELVLSSVTVKKQPVMCATILYLGHTLVCAHRAEAGTGLVSISYERLVDGHDAHVSKESTAHPAEAWVTCRCFTVQVFNHTGAGLTRGEGSE